MNTTSRLRVLGLDETETAALDEIATVVDVPVGTALCRQDHLGRQLAWILDGMARVERSGEVIALVGAGDVVGEGTMLGAHELCSADVVATTPMTVAVVSRPEWGALGERCPSLVRRLFAVALEREPRLVA
jgi:CRP/FNR family transcriptional regulator, cyclic AMP receptor protein